MMREKVIPVLWLMLASLIIGASIGFAARADATPTDEAALAICEQYDDWGATRGTTVRMASQMFTAGASTDEAAALFALAVTAYCPEYLQPVMTVMDNLAEGR